MVVLRAKPHAKAWSIVHETADHSHRHDEFVKTSCQTDSKTSKEGRFSGQIIDFSAWPVGTNHASSYVGDRLLSSLGGHYET